MEVNTHGLIIKGLEDAANETKGIHNRMKIQLHIQINYDLDTHEVYTNCLTDNSWQEYHDSSVIFVCDAYREMTMQEIADYIAEAVRINEIGQAEREAMQRNLEAFKEAANMV